MGTASAGARVRLFGGDSAEPAPRCCLSGILLCGGPVGRCVGAARELEDRTGDGCLARPDGASPAAAAAFQVPSGGGLCPHVSPNAFGCCALPPQGSLRGTAGSP